MISWQVVRHQVAVAGRVNDARTGKPIGDAEVVITGMPAAFKKKLDLTSKGSPGATTINGLDKTRTRPDGLFYFLDLPDGDYTFRAWLPRMGKRYSSSSEKATVSRDANGSLKMAFVVFGLQPTTVSGKITAKGQKPGVVMAEVRMKGSGERAFSDGRGQYLLSAIEPGKRVVLVAAQGYRSTSETVTLKDPGEVQTLNFNLEAG